MTTHREPPKRIGFFARNILGKPLYFYQEVAGDAILDSIIKGEGHTYSVMMSRQAGKNQLSAVLESYLLFAYESGSIVKAAPTFSPQITNSRLRLMSMLESDLTRDRVWTSQGYIIGLAPNRELVEAQVGPRIFFFSAGPDSNIVGATASLLLEVDEAQDVESSKYDIELKPMGSTTNATTVFYGTAWSDETLLAKQIAHNRELEERDGIRRHFEFDWTVPASINPKYKKFVENEIARLGEDHVSIRTQFRLLPISGAGFLLNDLQRYLLKGNHHWLDAPQDDEWYVMGVDIAGEQRPKVNGEKVKAKRDSTIITIARMSFNELQLPTIEIVNQSWFTGMKYTEQYATIVALVQQWNIRHVVLDATGLGEGMASLLIEKFGQERITAFKFTRPSKSVLTYHLLALINSGRLKMYSPDNAPQAIYDEAWKQLKHARYSVPAEGMLNIYVPNDEGHDDFLLSIALTTKNTEFADLPPQPSLIVKPRRLYKGESRY